MRPDDPSSAPPLGSTSRVNEIFPGRRERFPGTSIPRVSLEYPAEHETDRFRRRRVAATIPL